MNRVLCLLLVCLAFTAVAVNLARVDDEDSIGDEAPENGGPHNNTGLFGPGNEQGNNDEDGPYANENSDYGYADEFPEMSEEDNAEGDGTTGGDEPDLENPEPDIPGWPIEFAPAAELINGIDDIDAAGSCTVEIKKHCDQVEPGAARLADCVQGQIEAEESGTTSADQGTVSSSCKAELLDFKALRSTNINLNTNLAKSCKMDADKHCNNTWFFGYQSGQVLTCLRERKEMLTGPCKEEVFKMQIDAALDYRADISLFQACRQDAQKRCAGVEPGGGRIQACLREKRMELPWACTEELSRQEIENADDIRLSVQMFRKCLGDKKKFCADAPPGNSLATECLLEHREEGGFSVACGEELDAMMARRVRNFRLDPGLQRDCEMDILNMCAWYEDVDSVDRDDAAVGRCLQDYLQEITAPACKQRVLRYKRLSAQDIRFNVALADSCFDDQEKYCSDVAPGSARVIRCLETNRELLSINCRANLFDEEQRFSESIEYQYPMRQACTHEMRAFCRDVPPGNARVIRCLQESKVEAGFGKGCKEEVARYEQRAAGDYRLNFRLNKGCNADVKALCRDACRVEEGQICEGSVQRCLVEKRAEIKSEACVQELTYAQRVLASDGRYDSILAAEVAEACRQDALTHCITVLSGAVDNVQGSSLIHTCLLKNLVELSAGCKANELLLQQQERETVGAAGKAETAQKLQQAGSNCAATCGNAKRDRRWFWWGRCAWCKVQGGLW